MDIQTLLQSIGNIFNNAIFPFILALAGFVFLYNVVRYFIIGGANSEDQEKARTLALWGILAFVFIVSIWGIVNTLANIFGGNPAITPDYMERTR